LNEERRERQAARPEINLQAQADRMRSIASSLRGEHGETKLEETNPQQDAGQQAHEMVLAQESRFQEEREREEQRRQEDARRWTEQRQQEQRDRQQRQEAEQRAREEAERHQERLQRQMESERQLREQQQRQGQQQQQGSGSPTERPTSSRGMAFVPLRSLATAVERYHGDVGHYPTTEQGLAALFSRPADLPDPTRWQRAYVTGSQERTTTDPWGSPFRYASPGRDGRSFDIWSVGPDGVDGTADDVGHWMERRDLR